MNTQEDLTIASEIYKSYSISYECLEFQYKNDNTLTKALALSRARRDRAKKYYEKVANNLNNG